MPTGHVQPRHVYVVFSLVIWYYILVYILVFYVIYDAPGRENPARWQGEIFFGYLWHGHVIASLSGIADLSLELLRI
jgi:hypothetical protein